MRIRRWLLAGAAIVLLAGCGGEDASPSPSAPIASGPTPTPPPSPSPTPTTIAFAEEFNAGQFNTAIWKAEGPNFWVNNELQAYVNSPDTIALRSNVAGADGGVLVLKPKWAPGQDPRSDRRADFQSGRIDTRGAYDFTYGRAQARIKMSEGTGLWPAFWLLGNGTWPATGEIDIMEFVGEPGWISAALHGSGYSGANAFSRRFNFPAGVRVSDWHIYSAEWSSTAIAFAVDGNEYFRITRSEVERSGPWAFDTPKHIILNFALGGDYPFGVNGVTTPYRGLPQSTVDAITAGEAEMLVDWVRVTPP
jgi:beta-glucanase (GH16 family)